MDYYLGIDGGGTKTTAAVSDDNGRIIYKSVGKTVNFYSVGMEKARENLADIMNDIYENIGDVIFKSVFVGCSALDNEADTGLTDTLCSGIIKSEKIKMNSDVYVALFSGDCTVPRCVVICGTGSMAAGIDADNKITVKGGWGHMIGDGGSAYSIAVNALAEAVNLYDENRKDEPLVKIAKDFFKTDDLRKIIDAVYSEETTKDKLADFAKLVSYECEKGEKFSSEILSDECNKLLRTVYSLSEEMKECEILYLYGGVFQNNPIFKSIFTERFNRKYPDIKVEMLTVAPEEGALKIARETL